VHATTNQAYQILKSGLPGALYSAFAYFNGSVYTADVDGTLKAFTLNQALPPATPTSQSTAIFTGPGTPRQSQQTAPVTRFSG
jgi:hypothetical protein